MYLKVVGDISESETIATGRSIRERRRLWKTYGKGRWRKKRVLRTFDLMMVRSFEPNSTGTKLMG